MAGKKGKTIGFNLPDSNQDSYSSPKKEDIKSVSSDPMRAPITDLPEPGVNEQEFYTGENRTPSTAARQSQGFGIMKVVVVEPSAT